MTTIIAILSATLVGLTVGILVNLLLKNAKTRDQQSVEKKNKSLTGLITEVRQGMKILEENPDAPEAKKATIVLGIVFGVFFLAILGNVIFGILGGIVVSVGMRFIADQKRAKQKDLFEGQLIEALSLLTSSVRAGQSLVQALERMVQDARDPLKNAFTNALQKVRLGVPLPEALQEMADKVQIKDLSITIATINLARESGGNVGEMLTRIAETIRERKKIKGKIEALTAQGRTSAIVIAALPFIMIGILYVISPEMQGLLFTTVAGNIMLAVVTVLVAVGMFVINKIVEIDI